MMVGTREDRERGDKKPRANVYLDRDAYERLRYAEFAQGRPMSAIVTDALMATLPPVPRVPSPVAP